MNVSRLLLITGLGFSMQCRAVAQLATQSPFLPPPGSAAVQAENTPIELRGILARDQGVKYCIYDTARKTSVWVGLNEKGYDFLIKGQDLAKDTVTVEQGGRTFALKLREAKIVAGAQVATPVPGPGAVPVAGTPNAVTQNVVLNPTSADEAKRLEDTVSEIQRRRALREAQAGGGQVNAVPVAPQAAPAAPPAGNVNRAVR